MTTAIIVAAGKSERMGSGVDKAFLPLCSKPVLAWSLLAFERSPEIDRIVLVVRKDQLVAAQALAKMFGIAKLKGIVPGGKTRAESVQAGLAQCDIDTKTVVVHDGARPLVSRRTIAAVVEAAAKGPAVAGIRVTDALKRVEKGMTISGSVERDKVWAVQTPQAFPVGVLRDAYKAAGKADFADDSEVVEKAGGQVKVVECVDPNFKITVASDLQLAAYFLK